MALVFLMNSGSLFSENLAEETSSAAGITPDSVQQNDEQELRKEIEDLKKRVNELEALKEDYADLKKEIRFLNDLQISGFFDAGISNYKNKQNVFSVGSFELDIQHTYDHFQVAAALVFDKGASLDVGFIDYHLFGGTISPRGRPFHNKGIHLQIGRFDVPFGNDWYSYSSVSRITVTEPLTTEIIMDGGYNDDGIRLMFNFISFNATFYVLQGIDQKYTYGGNSYGGRIALTPFSNPYKANKNNEPVFETGFSMILDFDSAGLRSETLYAGDIKTQIGPAVLSGEYYYRDKKAGITSQGWHGDLFFCFGYFSSVPLTLFGRFDQCEEKEYVLKNEHEVRVSNGLTKICAGLNFNISDISYLKFEYDRFIKAYEDYKDPYYSKNLYYLQLAISF